MPHTPLTAALVRSFSDNSDTTRAAAMAAYMKHIAPYYGIPSPLRRTILRECLREHPVREITPARTAIQELYAEPQRECHYAAIDILWLVRKWWTEDDIELMEKLTLTTPWWDTVDALAKCVGEHNRRFPVYDTSHLRNWVEHDSLWLNRIAIIHQLAYGNSTDVEFLEYAILRHANSHEFFHRKAIGWALRQYSYANPNYVRHFVEEHHLHSLSVREALKGLKRREKG